MIAVAHMDLYFVVKLNKTVEMHMLCILLLKLLIQPTWRHNNCDIVCINHFVWVQPFHRAIH